MSSHLSSLSMSLYMTAQSSGVSASPHCLLSQTIYQQASLWGSYRKHYQRLYWNLGRQYPLLFLHLLGQLFLARSLSSCPSMTSPQWSQAHYSWQDFLVFHISVNCFKISCSITFPYEADQPSIPWVLLALVEDRSDICPSPVVGHFSQL